MRHRRLALLPWLLLAALSGGCGYGPDSEAGWCGFGTACAPDQQPAPSAVAPVGLSVQGTGPVALDVPADVSAVTIVARYAGTSESFVVRDGAAVLVDDLLGSDWGPMMLAGTYPVTPGGQLQIVTGAVDWQLNGTTVAEPVVTDDTWTAVGTGAMVLRLPARTGRYRVDAQYAGRSQAFVVRADGRLVIDEALGTGEGKTSLSQTQAMTPGSLVEISGTRVDWQIVEAPSAISSPERAAPSAPAAP